MKVLAQALSCLVMVMTVVTAEPMSAADALSKLPDCAISCFTESLSQSQCATNTSQTCTCYDEPFKQAMSGCVISSCHIRDVIVVQNITSIVCGYPIRNKSDTYVAVATGLGIVSGIFVIQRFAYKFWAKMSYGLDDWFTLLSIFVGIPNTVMSTHGLGPNGIGRDAYTLTYQKITNFGLFFYIMEIIYFIEVALSKLALLFFYIRIFPARDVRRLLWGTVVFVTLYGIAFALCAVFQCWPIDYFWQKWDGEHQGRCVNINALAWTNAGISIILDGWMLAIPLWQLKNLNLDWRKKIGVGLMFSVGTFVTIVSILRLRSLVKFGADSLNPTWDFYDVGMWSVLEINIAIICACLPSLRLLLVQIFPKLFGTIQHRYGKYSGNQPSLRGASRQFGTTTVSHVERPQHRSQTDSQHIMFSKTFSIHYSEEVHEDETHIVRMKSLDLESSHPPSRSGESAAS